ncbi:hypothetical protein PQE71_gp059 [Bacillus phage Izhevsk]|uniref:Uncharacterized protein n=1 Tax=Bacillus phage Izhevsk TaxID=2724322 RepID=A0A6H0X5Z4_9CAUD|nr:hypothetical protein PQE71_gp059 [Bacillus phage Izhevsk]QIW89741.1 hypothetical protein Izhevsk_60 [Bacillus phage Izhevsk]
MFEKKHEVTYSTFDLILINVSCFVTGGLIGYGGLELAIKIFG